VILVRETQTRTHWVEIMIDCIIFANEGVQCVTCVGSGRIGQEVSSSMDTSTPLAV
jgi:hypothetical protein